MIPVLGIVGFSGSGKTTLIVRLIPALREHGLRIAVLKHDVHPTIFDQPGKDSRRFIQAGAEAAAVASGVQTMLIENRPLSPVELARRIEGVDLILAEGFKAASWPKLLVCGGEAGEITAIPLETCVAVIDDGERTFNLPRFRRDDISAIADFIAAGQWKADK